jgi:hypothetical protein
MINNKYKLTNSNFRTVEYIGVKQRTQLAQQKAETQAWKLQVSFITEKILILGYFVARFIFAVLVILIILKDGYFTAVLNESK